MNDAFCPGPPQPWSPHRIQVTIPRRPGDNPGGEHALAWAAAETIGAGDLTVACTGENTVICMTVTAENEEAAMAAAAAVAMAVQVPAQVS